MFNIGQRSMPDPGDHIDFSIIIPARNEGQHVRQCLESLLGQDCSDTYEVVVVDGMSEDDTARIVGEYVARDERVRLISNPRRITPVAFNLGIQAARGNFILTVGAHWYLPVDYLRQIADAFKRHPEVDCLGGRIIRMAECDTGRAIEAARATLLGGGLSARNYSMNESIVDQANIAYIWRRKVFADVGLFDERLVKNQDNEFNMRTLAAGLKTLYTPKVFFYYKTPETLGKLYRQMHGYASYIPLIQVKYHRPVYARYAMPLLGLVSWLTITLLGLLGAAPLALSVALLLAYLLTILIGALIIAFNHKSPKWWIKIFLSFLTIHIATSIGTLKGWLKLANFPQTTALWRDYHKLPTGQISSI